MTKKDYEVVAQVIRDHRNAALGMTTGETRTVALATIDGLAERMSGVLALNPAYKEDKFLRACGVTV